MAPQQFSAKTSGLQKHFLIALLVLLLVLLFYFVSPFIGTVIIAAVVVIGSYPIQKALMRKMPHHPNLAALLTLLIVTIIILTPLTLFLSMIAVEASQAYGAISQHLSIFFSTPFLLIPEPIANSPFGQWIGSVKDYFPLSAEDITRNIQNALSNLSAFLVAETTSVLRQFSVVLLNILLFFLALFYFLRDGEKLIQYISGLLPLRQQYRTEMFAKLKGISRSMIYGIFGSAIAQGFLAGIGFALAGVENAVFWAAMMAFASPVPYIGTAIIWIPTVIYMGFQGMVWPTVFLALWCVLIVGFADNFLKPYLIGEANAINPFLVLMVILGGVATFGLKGLIFGPFLLSLALTFLHIYQLEYKAILDKE